MSREEQDQARRLMIELVLATDVARHFPLLSIFNAKIAAGNLDLDKTEDLSLLLQMLLKCADISNSGKPSAISFLHPPFLFFSAPPLSEHLFFLSFFLLSSALRQALYLQWVDRITEEFFKQGDREKALGLPLSPFMDRATPKIPKSQINFIEFVCAPAWSFGCFRECARQLALLETPTRYARSLTHSPSPVVNNLDFTFC
jgi:hypothetical protein